MAESEYSRKLKDPRWQRRRLEIFQRDDWRCTNCWARDKTLHCHHIEYISGADPWDHSPEMLTTLCETCHNLAHSDYSEVVEYLGENMRAVGWGNFEVYALAISFLYYREVGIEPLRVAHLLGGVIAREGVLEGLHEAKLERERERHEPSGAQIHTASTHLP
jgi:hypothetical protein